MAEQCFIEKDSNPPVCGVHEVRLKEHQSSEDLSTLNFGEFTFLMCPTSGQVIDDSQKSREEAFRADRIPRAIRIMSVTEIDWGGCLQSAAPLARF